PAAPPRRSAAELQQAIAEIAARQQTIHRLTREEQEARQRETDGETEARRLETPDRAGDDESAVLADIRHRLDQLAASLDGAARETTLSGIEAGHGRILDRLDRLARKGGAEGRIDDLAAGMAE